MKIDLLAKFSVTKQVDASEAFQHISHIAVEDESVDLAYTHTRDKVIFTTKRLICIDVQGLTGSKKEYRSFPYSKISSFSVETAGTFDGDSDFKIWMSGVGVFEIKFSKKLDIGAVGKYLSGKLL